MLLARVFSGNCYANLQDYPQMTAHYRVAEKIARAVGDLEEVETIRYNIAATALDLGRAEEAYAYFHAACGEEKPAETLSVMALHKLARCCEALGKTEEALSALDRAERAKAVLSRTGIRAGNLRAGPLPADPRRVHPRPRLWRNADPLL